ncbi:hypothetical protein [Streptomyces sparsus]
MTVSAVLLLGLLIGFLLKIRYLRWLEALLCGAFGFLIAQTAAAPFVQTAIDGVNALLGQLRF